MPLLQAILTAEDFDPEAKLVTIIAFGDVTLAAGPHNFIQYLPETQKSFSTASVMSLNKGSSPEEEELLEKLRIALCESYLSIMHGLYDTDSQQIMNEQN
eukprot:CAMPEP_0185623718 /NCGR_PEP_ID=MMETSP0436-20130131/60074_1 /TAXON_ID=626734 ORGANISM="Favella taraikaensis, Strain Fe Narragansett Bay" /NCGR_SAMPLE_ID=MMETSP0436 /ASSEMBLY_ACC=CAM_ASM_000390 /LENGTH=99 /DNA_ID=CAMNT_0028265875 /DNA_START=717 /DNA_END=1016 /DNA_ORIENTATION=-